MLAAAAAALVFVVGWSATPVLLHGAPDLDLFFWPAAQTAASGHPLLIYSTDTMGAGPVANGPLALMPLAGVAWLADVGHWANNVPLRTFAATAVFSSFVLLMAYSGVVMIERGRGAVQWRLGAWCAFLLAPTLWISVADFGHLEQPAELWLVCVAVAAQLRGKSMTAGVAIGLALLTRTTAILYVLPVAFVATGDRPLRSNVRFLASACVTASLGIAPFIVADGAHVVHSLIGARASAPIGGGSIWALAYGTSWEALAVHGDTYLAAALAAILCCAVRFHRREFTPSAANAFALLTIAAACFPMLARTAYPYYFVEPSVFGTIWWLARPGFALNWLVAVPLLTTIDALFTKWGAMGPGITLGVVDSIASSAVMALVIGLVGTDLARKREANTGPAALVSSGQQ